MIVSLLLTMINNVADAMWVSGLGSDALAAIGIVTPIFIIIIGLGIGISAGVNSSVARFIGKGDLKQAGNSGVHGLIISIIISIIIPVILLVFLKQILIAIGGASVLDLAYDYGFWIIIGAFSVIVQYVFSGVYRSENKGIKSNFPLALAAILNICLDPIFIYTFNMGVAGAAIATVLSNIISLMLFIYWRYIKGGELLDLNTYNKNMSIYKDIISVGVSCKYGTDFNVFVFNDY